MRMQWAAPILVAIAGLITSGCTERVSTFNASAQGVHVTGSGERTGPCGITVNRTGTGSYLALTWVSRRDAGGAGMLAGYSNAVLEGADPEPCDHWFHHEMQGLFVFNTSGLMDRAVANARLEFTAEPFLERDGRALRLTNCGFIVESADVLWPVGLTTSTTRLPARPARTESGPFNMSSLGSRTTLSFDVTTTVSEWLRGARENFGFAVTADRRFINERVDRYCTAIIDNARLEVTTAER